MYPCLELAIYIGQAGLQLLIFLPLMPELQMCLNCTLLPALLITVVSQLYLLTGLSCLYWSRSAAVPGCNLTYLIL